MGKIKIILDFETLFKYNYSSHLEGDIKGSHTFDFN